MLVSSCFYALLVQGHYGVVGVSAVWLLESMEWDKRHCDRCPEAMNEYRFMAATSRPKCGQSGRD